MDPFTYDALPGRVVFGAGASRERLADEVGRLGASRVLVLSTERGRGLAAELAAPLGDLVCGHFSEARRHVPTELAQQANRFARDARADCLLAVGGGSVTGLAKAIALETGMAIAAVPTTYAGSEMTPLWGLTQGQRKTTGRAPGVQPKVVIYDPALTLSLPPSVSGPSALNAMAHCVEAFYAPRANPLTSLMAEEGMRAIARGLPGVIARPDDLEARGDTLYGAYLAGAAFAVAGSGLHHRICHVLGGRYDLPHAETHAIILPHVLAYNQSALGRSAARMAAALGADDPAQAIYDLLLLSGAPTALQDIGMAQDGIGEAAALCLEAAPAEGPRQVDAAALRSILEEAFFGRRPAS